jgi:hypothetical protein
MSLHPTTLSVGPFLMAPPRVRRPAHRSHRRGPKDPSSRMYPLPLKPPGTRRMSMNKSRCCHVNSRRKELHAGSPFPPSRDNRPGRKPAHRTDFPTGTIHVEVTVTFTHDGTESARSLASQPASRGHSTYADRGEIDSRCTRRKFEASQVAPTRPGRLVVHPMGRHINLASRRCFHAHQRRSRAACHVKTLALNRSANRLWALQDLNL